MTPDPHASPRKGTLPRALAVGGWVGLSGTCTPLGHIDPGDLHGVGAGLGLTAILGVVVGLPVAWIANRWRPAASAAPRSGLAHGLWALALIGVPAALGLAVRTAAATTYDLPGDVAIVLAVGVGLPAGWLAWLLVPMARPSATRPHVILPAGLGLVASVVMWSGPLHRVAPESLDLAFLVVLGSSALATLAAGALLPPRGRRWGLRAGWALLALGLVALALLPASGAADSPAGLSSLRLLRTAADRDGDGFAAVLEGGDCNDSDPQIHPLAVERVGNGVDDNCAGGDLAPPPPLPATAPARPDLASAPDIVLISIDTVRADHFRPGLMPRLTAYAAGARRFSDATAAAPHTDLSMRSTFTGWPPSDYDHMGRIIGMDRPLADVLAEVGYQTFALHSVPDLGELVTLGFQFQSKDLARLHQRRDGTSAPQITRSALDLLERPREPGRPRLLWVHYFDPHHQYVPHPGFEALGHSLKGLYRQELAFVDAELGPLLDHLARPEVAERTVVIVLSDHGESLGEHGRLGHDLRLLDPVARVPLLVRAPGMPAGTDPTPVSLLDVFPTVIDLAGIEGVEARAGHSLRSPPPDHIRLSEGRASHRAGAHVAIRVGSWLLHCAEEDALCRLFETRSDPGCVRDRAGDQPEKLAELRGLLAGQLDHYRNDARQAARRAAWIARWATPAGSGD